MIPRDVNLSIRLERAQSWIELAKSSKNSEHAQFIFYWIAFNAMYGLTPVDPNNLEKEPAWSNNSSSLAVSKKL